MAIELDPSGNLSRGWLDRCAIVDAVSQARDGTTSALPLQSYTGSWDPCSRLLLITLAAPQSAGQFSFGMDAAVQGGRARCTKSAICHLLGLPGHGREMVYLRSARARLGKGHLMGGLTRLCRVSQRWWEGSVFGSRLASRS